MRRSLLFLAAGMSLLVPPGCSSVYEQVARREWSAGEDRYPLPAEPAPDALSGDLQRGLPGYVAYALARSPELRASFERWRASVHRISRARRLPEPTITFGHFVQSVETRVGPQLARISVQQSFPWPAKLTAGADAASAQARALERRFDAQTLALTQRVADAYWRVWLIRKTRAIHAEHLQVLRSLSESVQARMVTGQATLADQQQVDLAAARLEDMLRGMGEAERTAEAQLRAAIGAPGPIGVPTPGEPPDAQLPLESEEALANLARRHPMIASLGFMAQAQESAARAEAADRYPGFTIGADWIITGDALMSDVPNSGQDAVVVGAGIRVPLWQRSYSDGIAAAQAEANAQREEARAATDRAMAELEASLASVRDAVRRVGLFRDTLVPLAESAYESVLGAYVTGRGTVAQTLLAQRDLLELRVELDRARADHAQGWARLEQVVGHQLEQSSAADQNEIPEGPYDD